VNLPSSLPFKNEEAIMVARVTFKYRFKFSVFLILVIFVTAFYNFLEEDLYITNDIICDITGWSAMCGERELELSSLSSIKRLLRHTAMVPKGFLRFYVLRLLREKPMSGSEIMEKIKKETGGVWKPSPGSMYPLLAWLRDNGYAEELPPAEGGIKRYKLTEKGEKFLEEQIKYRGKIFKKIGSFVPPPFFMSFMFGPRGEEWTRLRQAGRRFVRAFLSLRKGLMEKPAKQAIKEFAEILNNTAEKMEELNKRLEKEGD